MLYNAPTKYQEQFKFFFWVNSLCGQKTSHYFTENFMKEKNYREYR